MRYNYSTLIYLYEIERERGGGERGREGGRERKIHHNYN